jgi:probable phosphoglycerate mutase
VTAGPRRHEVVLVRHAETEWSRDGRHTGRTDIPLTDGGRQVARALRARLGHRRFALALTSPLSRALQTAELAGFGAIAQPCDDLQEWDYGGYEGLTTPQIQAARPDWSLWRDGCPGGERAEDVGARADRVLARLEGIDGDAVVFSHGHMLRVLAARWLRLDAAAGALLALDAGGLSVLGHEHEARVLQRWNLDPGGLDASIL